MADSGLILPFKNSQDLKLQKTHAAQLKCHLSTLIVFGVLNFRNVSS